MASTPGYITDKQAVLTRLRRIEGQVRRLPPQVEDDTYCVDILTQVAAATKALESVALNFLTSTCSTASSTPPTSAERDLKLTEASQAIARPVRA